MIKKILIINPFGIGDVLFSTPLIAILKSNFPEAGISYVCNRRVAELIATNPHLDKLFIYEKDDYRGIWQRSRLACIKKIMLFLWAIKKEKFDVAVDLSLGYQYSLLLKFIGVKKRLGFNYKNRGRFLTDKISIEGFGAKHVIEYYLDMLKLLNIETNARKTGPQAYVAPESAIRADAFLKDKGVDKNDLLVGVIPGCGASWGIYAPYRRWDKRKFAMVCDEISERYAAKVILFGDSRETRICADIAEMMKYAPILSCGKVGVGDFLGLLNKCSLVITNDGGPLHMAVGLGVSTISIFGPVDETIYGPYPPDAKHIVITKNDIACRPCYNKFKFDVCEKRTCLDSITVEDVLSAVEKVLSRRTRTRFQEKGT